MRRGDKKGLVLTTSKILMILISLAAVSLIFTVVYMYSKDSIQTSKAYSEMLEETTKMSKISIDNNDLTNVQISLCCSEGDGSTTQKVTVEKNEDAKLSIALVIDRSGSMRQSGWTMDINNGLEPLTTFENVEVPSKATSSTYSFLVPEDTERLAILLTWDQEPGYPGSEASEFALNVKEPSHNGPYNGWFYNYSGEKPNVGGKVDPPDNTAFSYDYFSGIDTKPQIVYVENPLPGNWKVQVYGWNFRPKTNRPSTQKVNITVYVGNESSLVRNPTVISIKAVKEAAKDFFDKLGEDDKADYTVFGSYGWVIQYMTDSVALLKNAVDLTGLEGGTQIDKGINVSRDDLIVNGTSGSKKVMIILTDGQNDYGSQVVIDAANYTKEQGIIIYTIGLTGFVDPEMLKEVATGPSYYIYAPDASVLPNIFGSLRERMVKQIYGANSDGFKVVFYNATFSYSPPIFGEDFGPYQVKTYEFNLEGKITNITKVELYPIKVVDGKTIIGPVLQSYEVH